MENNSYKVLYAFQSHGLAIVEIKCLDAPANASPENIYHWLRIDLKKAEIARLHFIAQEEDEDGVQYREFEEGQITFDSEYAEFIDDNEDAIALDALYPKEIESAEFHTLIKSYLNLTLG